MIRVDPLGNTPHALGTTDSNAFLSCPTLAPISQAESAVLRALTAEPQAEPLAWPPRPAVFRSLMTPVEATQYLRLDELGTHTPKTAIRTLNYFRDHAGLRATKYARHVWYLKDELDRFLSAKTDS